MTSQWIVAIEAARDSSTAVDKETLAQLIRAVADMYAVALHSHDRYAVQLRVSAETASEALSRALGRWSGAVRAVQVPEWPVVRAEVMTPAELEIELESGEPDSGAVGGDSQFSDTRWRLILQDCRERLILLSAEGAVVFSLPPLDTSGVDRSPTAGPTTLADIAHPDDGMLVSDALAHLLSSDSDRESLVIRLPGGEGWRWFRATARNLLNEPNVGAVVVTCADVTKEMELEERLAELANHDELTGLATRAVLLDAMELALGRPAERSQTAVFFVDIDDFRGLVERRGPEVGDRVLISIGERLRSVRDEATAARLGRDEFALLSDNVTDSTDAAQIAKRIASLLSEPVDVDGDEVEVTVSIGVALGRSGRLQAATLLRHAEVAMYRARRGRARYEIFRRRQRSQTGSDVKNAS